MVRRRGSAVSVGITCQHCHQRRCSPSGPPRHQPRRYGGCDRCPEEGKGDCEELDSAVLEPATFHHHAGTMLLVYATRMSCNYCRWICVIGSRPSDHYFRSVCLFVCLFVQNFSQPSLIRFPSNLDIFYMSGSSCVP